MFIFCKPRTDDVDSVNIQNACRYYRCSPPQKGEKIYRLYKIYTKY